MPKKTYGGKVYQNTQSSKKSTFSKRRQQFKKGMRSIAEKKIHNDTIIETSIPGVSVLGDPPSWVTRIPALSSIEQGTGKNQRVGSKIFMRYITFNVEIYSSRA